LSQDTTDAGVGMAPASQEKRMDMTVLLCGLITYGIGQSLLYVIFGPMARDLGLSETQFGILISVSNVAIVFTAPWWGRKSQDVGRKPIFIIGLLGYAVGYAGLAIGIQLGISEVVAVSTSMLAPLFLLLLGARLIYGSMASAIQPAATAYIADTTDEAGRTKGMALVGMTAGLGTIIGPIFGGILARFGALLPMYVAATLSVLAAIAAAKYIKEPKRHVDITKAKVKLSWFDPRIFPYLLGWFVGFMVFTAVQVITAFIVVDNLGLTNETDARDAVMFALLCMGVVNVLVMITLLQKIKVAPVILLRIAFILLGLVFFFLSQATTSWMFFLSYAGIGLAFSLATPSLNSAASLAVEAHEQGSVAGLLAAAPTLGMIFGPAGGAFLYQINPLLPMYVSGTLSILLGIFFFFIKVKK
jgi:MFS family permease